MAKKRAHEDEGVAIATVGADGSIQLNEDVFDGDWGTFDKDGTLVTISSGICCQQTATEGVQSYNERKLDGAPFTARKITEAEGLAFRKKHGLL